MSRVNNFAWILFAGSFAYLFFVIAVILFKVAGPSLEVKTFPPIKDLYQIELTCLGEDAYFKFFLGKRNYFNGTGAELKGLSIKSGRTALPWRSAEVRDRSPLSAPAGEQERDLVVIRGCGKPFIMITEHVSPITGLSLTTRFGPFGGGE